MKKESRDLEARLKLLQKLSPAQKLQANPTLFFKKGN